MLGCVSYLALSKKLILRNSLHYTRRMKLQKSDFVTNHIEILKLGEMYQE